MQHSGLKVLGPTDSWIQIWKPKKKKKTPLQKVVSACCCPSSWTQLWKWEQCLLALNNMWCFDSEPQIWKSQGDITKEPMHQGVFGRQSFVRIVI